MTEYIERKIALSICEPSKSDRHYQTYNLDDAYGQGWDDALCCIETIPVADVAPVRHGRWECGKPCPVCGEDRFKGLDADIWADWEPPYCPNCGAKMNGG